MILITCRRAALAFAIGAACAAPIALRAEDSRLAAASPAEAPQINIDNFTFAPATITVKAGTTITWLNRDDIPHTVTTQDRKIKSPVLDTDDKFSFVFDQPGAYTYFCSIHPHMTATVVVVP